MTEDEAKTKWCPHVRIEKGIGSAANRNSIAHSMCIASECMMWRHTNEVTGRGYCGLAGRP